MFKYSVIGLGKVGASLAAAIASRGASVIGVDIDASKVDAINQGRAPVNETGLAGYVAENHHRLTATTDHREAVRCTDITFVVVPTPSNEGGGFSLRFAAVAFEELGHALRDKSGYHVIALVSTVLPGATRHRLLPVVEDRSKKRCGLDFGVCYTPSFIALGSVIEDFLHPDFTLVGQSDSRSGDVLRAAYKELLPGSPECRCMTLENAELAKIAINSFITMKLSFANLLADLCERIPGGDVDVITSAVGLDTRIGGKYLRGALGYGGPCFPRDNRALAHFATAVGSRADLAETTDRFNRSWISAVSERIRLAASKGTTVAILGLAYKPKSDEIEGSQGIQIARALGGHGIALIGHDPMIVELPRKLAAEVGITLKSIEACLRLASVVVIAIPDPLYAGLEAIDFLTSGEAVTVVDCWRILRSKLANRSDIEYIPIGCSLDDRTSEARLSALWRSEL